MRNLLIGAAITLAVVAGCVAWFFAALHAANAP
jgi:hypothetical protein